MMGDFVTHGAPLVRVQRDGALLDRERGRWLIALDDETTAGQVVNRLHDCLRQIADQPFPSGHIRDEEGDLRVIERVLDWDVVE
jgi:hypothetical protein